MSVSISRIRPMLVARSALGGIAVEIVRSSSSHPDPFLRTAPALISRGSFGPWNLWSETKCIQLVDFNIFYGTCPVRITTCVSGLSKRSRAPFRDLQAVRIVTVPWPGEIDAKAAVSGAPNAEFGKLLYVNRTCLAASRPKAKRTPLYGASLHTPFAMTDSAKGPIDASRP